VVEGRRTNTSFSVLLVEDDPNDAEFLTHAFRKIGCPDALRVAGSVDRATAYLERLGGSAGGASDPFPLLVLLDLKLPGRSGLEFLDWLRKRRETKYLPVVVLTSSTEPRDMISAYERGANSYTVKPLSPNDFVPMMESIIHYWGSLNRIPGQL
jgi:two-component system response regulator